MVKKLFKLMLYGFFGLMALGLILNIVGYEPDTDKTMPKTEEPSVEKATLQVETKLIS